MRQTSMNKSTIITIMLALVCLAGQGQTKTSALVRGSLLNIPKQAESQLTIYYYNPLVAQSSFANEIPLQPDSLGRFEVEVPLTDTSPVQLVFQRLMLSPGKKYDVEMNGWDFKLTCDGSDASLANEMLNHEPPRCSWNFDTMDGKTDAFVLEAAEKELQRMEAAIDSMQQANPSLSPEWRYCARYRALASLAQAVVQQHFTSPAVRQNSDGRLWQWLHDRFICDLPRPYSIIEDRLGYIIMYYMEEFFAPRTRSKLNLPDIDAAIDIVLDGQADGTISRTEAFADSLRTLRTMLQDYKALAESNAADSLIASHPFERAAKGFFSDPYLKNIFRNGIVSERTTAQYIKRIASLDMPEEVRDLARAVMLYNEIDQYHAPLRPALGALLGEVKDNYLRNLVTERSNHYRDLALLSKADEASLMPNEPLAGLTDGKEIFSKIIEPYRGRILLVDFWGTWCVPCKMYLKNNTHSLHQALSDLPVTYIFLCNGSETEAWRSTIAEYKLTGKDFVHYNLPADQQQAVQEYLGVHKYPTYIIFDKDGQRVTTEADEPRPYQPEAVRETMLKLKDK
ncbi:MAG: redoxin family protein [Bacteroidaceae bacterium]|nr:redoxin family protein [Bacteroidaceae bacterium]